MNTKILSKDQVKTLKGMLNHVKYTDMRTSDLTVLSLRFWPSLRSFNLETITQDISLLKESKEVESNIENYTQDQGE